MSDITLRLAEAIAACEAGANAADRTAAKARALFANPMQDPFGGNLMLRAQAEQDYEHVVNTAKHLRALAAALRGAERDNIEQPNVYVITLGDA